ncbi:ABC-three component system protein [Sphingobacterium sp.]|uniref:ABC-three component system protein n=1 Tax=Sphingobacterium sp. TaxID=341027 RepID=UPI002582CD29|nr:ABC-three component system protein [Sphingobacterium sp.]WET67956.1 MAG: hypothetical protein P0Y57_19125 [Sphingobacterium sp.]
MSDQLRPYVVIVNNGSGCVFQPMDIQISYILTAKHNLVDEDDHLNMLTRFEQNGGNWIPREIPFEPLEIGQNYFPHPQLDIAIITVPRIHEVNSIYRSDELNEQMNPGYNLLGYPATRRQANLDNKSLWFRSDAITQILGQNNNAREFTIAGNANQEEVTGQSGGPILILQQHKAMIAGIETNMARAFEENMGRAEFFPLATFDEIIAQNPDKLCELLPAHLSCFSFLMEEAFDLDAGFAQDNIAGIKAFLLHKAKLVTQSGATPHMIKKQFAKRLLIAEQKEEILQGKEIWKIWLEFITIMQIIQEKIIEDQDLEALFNTVRLLHSDSDKDWSSELTNIVYSDYLGLADKGTVVISTRKPPASDDQYIIHGNIPQIASAKKLRDREKLKINEGMIFPFDHYKFVHMDYFKGKSISRKHAEYSALDTDQEYLDKLKLEYGEIFNHQRQSN